MGRFDNREMKGAQLAEVKGHRCNQFGIMEVSFSNPSGPIIEYWPPSNTSFGAGPQVCRDQISSSVTNRIILTSLFQLPDPYESKHVEVVDSSIPNSGQGLVAKTDLKNGTVVAFLSGFVYRNEEEINTYQKR